MEQLIIEMITFEEKRLKKKWNLHYFLRGTAEEADEVGLGGLELAAERGSSYASVRQSSLSLFCLWNSVLTYINSN